MRTETVWHTGGSAVRTKATAGTIPSSGQKWTCLELWCGNHGVSMFDLTSGQMRTLARDIVVEADRLDEESRQRLVADEVAPSLAEIAAMTDDVPY